MVAKKLNFEAPWLLDCCCYMVTVEEHYSAIFVSSVADEVFPDVCLLSVVVFVEG